MIASSNLLRYSCFAGMWPASARTQRALPTRRNGVLPSGTQRFIPSAGGHAFGVDDAEGNPLLPQAGFSCAVHSELRKVGVTLSERYRTNPRERRGTGPKTTSMRRLVPYVANRRSLLSGT
jgi:hypothetical protein